MANSVSLSCVYLSAKFVSYISISGLFLAGRSLVSHWGELRLLRFTPGCYTAKENCLNCLAKSSHIIISKHVPYCVSEDLPWVMTPVYSTSRRASSWNQCSFSSLSAHQPPPYTSSSSSELWKNRGKLSKCFIWRESSLLHPTHIKYLMIKN